MEINFSMLSLNNTNETGYNIHLYTKTIDDLFMSLYSYEEPNISFENLEKKLIEFYFDEATEELIITHLTAIEKNTDKIILQNIFENVIKNDYDKNNNFSLNAIIEFISSNYGKEYLRLIYSYFN